MINLEPYILRPPFLGRSTSADSDSFSIIWFQIQGICDCLFRFASAVDLLETSDQSLNEREADGFWLNFAGRREIAIRDGAMTIEAFKIALGALQNTLESCPEIVADNAIDLSEIQAAFKIYLAQFAESADVRNAVAHPADIKMRLPGMKGGEPYSGPGVDIASTKGIFSDFRDGVYTTKALQGRLVSLEMTRGSLDTLRNVTMRVLSAFRSS